jgi:hypothetical protein
VARLDARDEFLEASTSLTALGRESHLIARELRGMRLDQIYRDGRVFNEEDEADLELRRALRFQKEGAAGRGRVAGAGSG